jgi:hypothetical protein
MSDFHIGRQSAETIYQAESIRFECAEHTRDHYAHALTALGFGDYTEAAANLSCALRQQPRHCEARYLMALVSLRGQRPRSHRPERVRRVEELLGRVYAERRAPQDAALLALVKHDFHVSHGYGEGVPSLTELLGTAHPISPALARQICDHVPAPGSTVWLWLKERSA